MPAFPLVSLNRLKEIAAVNKSTRSSSPEVSREHLVAPNPLSLQEIKRKRRTKNKFT
jgi:hypothetical protein